MTVSSIGFQNAAIRAAGQSSSADADSSNSSDGSSVAKSDTVTISAQSLTLLQQSQEGQTSGHHHRHHLSDDQASQIGAKINQEDPALFKQLDKDGDGKLNAGELKEGIKQLREQQQEEFSAPTDKALGEAVDEDSAAANGTAVANEKDPANVKVAADELVLIRQAFAAVVGHDTAHVPDVTSAT